MKKVLFNIFLAICFVLLPAICLVACDEKENVFVDAPACIKGVSNFETLVPMNSDYSTLGGVVQIEMLSGKTQILQSDDERLSYSEVDTTGLGRKVLTITFEENDIILEYDLNIDVYLDAIQSINGITGMPKCLKLGQVFSIDDLRVTLTMLSGQELVMANGDTGLEISPVDTTTVGLHHLYIGYGDLTPYIFEYVVYDAQLTTVVSTQIKGTYNKQASIGSVYDASSIVLEVTLQIAGIDALQVQTYAFDDLVVTTPDTSSAGTKKLIATFYDDLLDVTYSGAAIVVVK